MALAPFAGNLIEPRTTQPALNSNTELDRLANCDFDLHSQSSEPRSISQKRKDNEYLDIPRFRRHFVWPTLDSPDILSPAVRFTETSPPLTSPPEHLVHDPRIQQTLDTLKDAIEVKTPFDVNKLELMLTDHPNPTFVRSVMKGLHEGFWPFDEGDWEAETGEVIANYATEELDLNVIRSFRDKEISRRTLVSTLRLFEPTSRHEGFTYVRSLAGKAPSCHGSFSVRS
jgi:hypothetical protein